MPRILELILQKYKVTSIPGVIARSLRPSSAPAAPPPCGTQTFERVRQALIRRYGAPASIFNRGDFRPTLVEGIQNDQFIRLSEWRTPEGVIRFGIPRRLDRLVRMEVQIARSFPDLTQTRWSFEDLR